MLVMRYLIDTNIFIYLSTDHVIISHAMTLQIPLISSDTRFEFYRKQGLDLFFNEK